LEAFNLKKAKPEIAVQYVDHNLPKRITIRPPVLQSAAARFGFWFSRTGIEQQYMERFGRPGKTLFGLDSHTPAGGGIGMLAIGTGGLDVAPAAAGELC
jgi:aconitate hydratase